MTIDTTTARKRLIARQEELQGLSKVSAQARGTVTLDQQSVGRLSRMDAMQQQAMAQETERKRAHELIRIENALSRLDSEDYGYCVECDQEIAAKRLEIDPAITLCIKCAGR